jgi:hypothetical protein
MSVLWILPNPRRCSRHWKGATVHICVRVDHASIPLGPFSHCRQYWYQAGYWLDVFHRIPVWQNIKLGNAEGRVVPSFGEEEISLLEYLAELRIDLVR